MFALVVIGSVCLAAAGIGGAVTALSVDNWYQELAKPPFNPPDWVFAPVWTALFLMMAVAAWRVWRYRQNLGRRSAMVLFATQLALNVLWSCLFFGLMAVGTALIEIFVLWVTIVVTTVSFRRIDRVASWLMLPYAIWVSFAAVLNAAIWWLN